MAMGVREKNYRKGEARLPPLNALRAFEAAARHLSMTRAAEELNVTHGAVSQHVRALEAATRSRLFERRGNRLQLTPAGSAVLQPLQAAFGLLLEATRATATGEVSGEVRLAAPPALATLWLAREIGPFLAGHPGLRLRLFSGPEARPPRGFDLAIRYGDGRWPSFVVDHLSDVHLTPVCSPGLLMSTPALRGLKGLANVPILCADDGEEWESWIAASGRARVVLGPRHHLGNALAAIELSAAGFGVALGDNVTTARYLAEGRLVCPIERSTRAASGFYLLTRPESEGSPAVAAARRWLRDSFARLDKPG
jgi:LysR family glycine cleavage system transcriptional activator